MATAALSSSWVLLALAGIGALALLRGLYLALSFLTFHLLTPSRPLGAYKRPGPEPTYALITGSSAGIGYGTAQELVRQGFGVILLSHIADELAASAERLRQLVPNAAVRTVVMDARLATRDDLARLVESLADLRVSILVNNVGGVPIALPAFRSHGSLSCAEVDAVIDMNARFMARLTALMLPLLGRKTSPKDRALIVNISSAGMLGVPWIVMYGATKAFNWAFSCGLARELELDPATRHIDSVCVIPGDVRTQGNSEGLSAGAPTGDVFGKCIVHKVDTAVSRRMRDMSPFWLHGIQRGLLGILPESARTSGLSDMLTKKKDAFNAIYEKSR